MMSSVEGSVSICVMGRVEGSMSISAYNFGASKTSSLNTKQNHGDLRTSFACGDLISNYVSDPDR